MQAQITRKNTESDSEQPAHNSGIRFLLNNREIHATGVEPTRSLLSYLREDQLLTGTKEGCAEGDCGTCVVVLAELVRGEVKLSTINACIRFVPTLHNKAVFTVEYLRQQSGGDLHPVQQAMVEQHGSQCGFCTPGFIMSLWAVYNRHQPDNSRPPRAEIRSALSGNLCRCTGYKPILQAAELMLDLPQIVLDQAGLQQSLSALQSGEALNYTHSQAHYCAPQSIDELLQLRSTYPQATLLAGGTDIGLWVNKQFRELNPVIYLGEVAELKTLHCNEDESFLQIGAGVTLTATYNALREIYPEMNQMWERFASEPIRNSGTLGGNIANGSPIGDSMPALIALGARVTLRSLRGRRELLLEDLYLDYMQKDLAEDEIVESVKIPLPDPQQQFRCYKLSKRYDSDISAVFSGMALKMDGDTVHSVRIAYGGMAAIPKRAGHCERALTGQPWSEATVRQAMQALRQDFSPLTDMRATDKNRMQSAMNLLCRFYLQTRRVDPLSDEQLDVFAQGDV